MLDVVTLGFHKTNHKKLTEPVLPIRFSKIISLCLSPHKNAICAQNLKMLKGSIGQSC